MIAGDAWQTRDLWLFDTVPFFIPFVAPARPGIECLTVRLQLTGRVVYVSVTGAQVVDQAPCQG
jgi:hypothetical protein